LIKCIATDMDGTLLGKDHLISEENIRAIKLAKEKGVDVIVATGRSLDGAKYPLEKAGLKLPLLVMNGAQLYDEEENLHLSIPLPKETVQKVIDILQDFDLYFEFYSNIGQISIGFEKARQMYKKHAGKLSDINNLLPDEESMLERFKTLKIKEIGSFSDLSQYENLEVYKFIIFSMDKQELDSAIIKLQALPEVVVSSSGFSNIEVNHCQAQKGIALEHYVKQKGFTLEETMAIGDSYNDLSMLKKAGVAVVMDNAHEDVKKVATFVTSSHDQDGFAKAVYKVLNM